MKVGVIGSGAIGPDLAYGFISALAGSGGGTVYLHDIRKEALDAGMARIMGYVKKGISRGKLSPKVGQAVSKGLVPTLDIGDLADCEYVLEAATEDLTLKKGILTKLEEVVSPDCLIGFATSGLPRSKIAAEVKHPGRCFVNHPFFPAWRSPPVEVVPSEDPAMTARMMATLEKLGKVPIFTADVVCFAADDVFVNYCAEAARLFTEGVGTPAQIDAIVNEAIGGGGPFNVMDLTSGNLLNVHCLELMRDDRDDGQWFEPPPVFTEQANTPWHDRKDPGDPTHDEATKKEVLDRILAVVFARTAYVVDNDICHPREMNWMTKNALGYRAGILDIMEEYGADEVHRMVTEYAARFDGFEVPPSIANKTFVDFYRHLVTERDGDLAVVTIRRPEVLNALSSQVHAELRAEFEILDADDSVKGIVLTSYQGAIAGADIQELAVLETPEAATEMCRNGMAVLSFIEGISKPVVAAVDGPVLGGGSELSMACHARVVGKRLVQGQPEVNLGIIPGNGGTMRLPRIVGFDNAVKMLRTAAPVNAGKACAMGWATGDPVDDPVAAAKDLIAKHLAGEVKLAPVDPAPMEVPTQFPKTEIGHHSLSIDAILCDVLRRGLDMPLSQGLEVEALGFGDCKRTIDFDIGMTNFVVNGPRVPADFINE
ncbi:MAG: 3-hydroxyacyl-CoA dehydrogenase/enoyl-CoA hydratase family protein [Planctomycetota bacterium]